MHPYILYVLIPFAACMMFGIAVKRYYEAKAEKTYQNLLQILDCALQGSISENVYDESMDAAVTARLNRLVQIAHTHRQSAEKERDTIKALISDISHQVRTPLTNMMLYTGLLKEQPLDSSALHLVMKLEKQSDKLDFFMKELVRSSYAEQEMISICPKQADPAEMIRTACQSAELLALKKQIVIEADLQAAEGVVCYADPKWTVEAAANVLENAVKYSPERSVIQVSALVYESFVCIQVKDQGIGIREEEQGLVFERFYRSEEVKETAGFGIGLYLVREVLRRQGGYARIRSDYGNGTAVQLYLSRVYGEC
ncbi:MAG: HAMP domain-containing histidine kinase [Eubacterium sp.]|nr:HAMP domain-containing histidine kinase [Eubacterium sp.]